MDVLVLLILSVLVILIDLLVIIFLFRRPGSPART